MKLLKLGQLFKVTSGGTPNKNNLEFYENGKIPWIKTGDLKTKEIKTVSFYEPDWNYGFTAFATEPLTIDKKQLLKRYQLWK